MKEEYTEQRSSFGIATRVVCMRISCMVVETFQKGRKRRKNRAPSAQNTVAVIMINQNPHPMKLLVATSLGVLAHFGTSEAGQRGIMVSAMQPTLGKAEMCFTFSKLTHVLDVGRRCSSRPASRIAKHGFSCLNPLCASPSQQPADNDPTTKDTAHSNGGRLQLVTKRKNARLSS